MVMLTDPLDMTIAVYWDVKPKTKQTKLSNRLVFEITFEADVPLVFESHFEKDEYYMFDRQEIAF